MMTFLKITPYITQNKFTKKKKKLRTTLASIHLNGLQCMRFLNMKKKMLILSIFWSFLLNKMKWAGTMPTQYNIFIKESDGS